LGKGFPTKKNHVGASEQMRKLKIQFLPRLLSSVKHLLNKKKSKDTETLFPSLWGDTKERGKGGWLRPDPIPLFPKLKHSEGNARPSI